MNRKHPADATWEKIASDAEARGLSRDHLAREFEQWAGFAAAEASAGELEAFAQHLREGDEPRTQRPGVTSGALQVQPGDSADDWVRVSGGGLSQPVDVRLAVRGGRPRIIGLRVDNGDEVTADFLREIRLGQIVEAVLRYADAGPAPVLSGLSADDREAVLWDWAAPGMFLQQLPEVEAGEVTEAKKGSPPPDSALRNFARVYLRRLTVRPHGAMAAAAREVHIARSTAYRWAELCRERGYLPQEG